MLRERGGGGARVGVAPVRRHGYKKAAPAAREGPQKPAEISASANRLDRRQVSNDHMETSTK